MLNFLRFREVADYSANPEIAPPEPISGREAYQKYIDLTLPFLTATGGEIMLLGDGGKYLIGPQTARWDLVMLIRQNRGRFPVVLVERSLPSRAGASNGSAGRFATAADCGVSD